MLDVEPLRFGGKANVDDGRRPLIDLNFIELVRSARDERPAPSSVAPPGAADRSDGASMACDKTVCWLIVPHSKPDRLAITTLRRAAQ